METVLAEQALVPSLMRIKTGRLRLEMQGNATLLKVRGLKLYVVQCSTEDFKQSMSALFSVQKEEFVDYAAYAERL